MPVEAELLSNKACAANMKEAEYLRLLISQKPNDYPEIRKLLKDLINEVNHIGNNINQIAHWANGKGYATQAEIHDAASLVKQAYRSILDTL